MRFAGFAEAARAFWFAFPLLAGLLACGSAKAQNPEARQWYERGVAALEAKRFAQARDDFLRAVEADPSFPAAWLDLAVAARAAGDGVQAEEFLSILESRFQLPGAIAAAVARLRQAIEADRLVPQGWQWSAVWQAGAGYDSNANAGLSRPDLTLTLPGGPLVLPLQDSQLNRGDAYLVASGGVEAVLLRGDHRWELSSNVRSRVNRELRQFDTVELQAGAAFVTSGPLVPVLSGGLLPGPWRLALTTQRIQLGRNALLNSTSLSATHAWAGASCPVQAGLEVDWRRFPVARNLDSRVHWMVARVACPASAWGPDTRWVAQVRAGHERARSGPLSESARPGANTRHLEGALLHRWGWSTGAGAHAFETQAQWARARDTAGYSPLLADNAPRNVSRGSLSAAYSFPLPLQGAESWAGTLTLQAFRQRSNIELFRLQGSVVQLTFKTSW